ncbi:MAG: hypothetical protein OTJ97_08225 [SAR202 cluster bacterium]|nr:hypothetical protein [SAR202 cluster bacterium]
MTENQRGRHRSSDKEGKKTIALLKSVPGVTAVVIGRSYGGKSLGRDRAAGDFKLQSKVRGGFKGVLQTSRGIQEIFVQVIEGMEEEVGEAIRGKF